MISMEKIDYVMNVTGAEYAVVRNALLDNDGDVEAAIDTIRSSVTPFTESKNTTGQGRSFGDFDFGGLNFDDITFDEIKSALHDIWKSTNATKVVVTKAGNVVFNLPLTAASVGIILAPVATLIGMGVGLVADYDFKVITADKEEIDIKDYILKKKKK
ncbi:DUF4342 domain-containing protein [Peptoniphilus equinus]|uniref:DUF4342 domain-containing protein n=1 Tax=Peptoniphilus equinus TaxID=3016343 RepID=A0ABY7QW70_9FIRM|nr:DUF4342 domain-containing protein [Peptoniphilus equinus]WBW50339.1 DUF4342 domain-containing protein [Peptoniphilus equinus]